MAGRLGSRAYILSRIGRDPLGEQALDILRPLPVETSAIQMDSRAETGRVTVTLNNGQPSYTIHEPAAWDFLDASEEWLLLAGRASAICFGSLAQRNPVSRAAIQRLVAASGSGCIRVFDVNLRSPFYTADILTESVALATVVKMNDAEVPLVLYLLGLATASTPGEAEWDKTRLRYGAEKLLAEFPRLDLVVITCGGTGSLLVRRDEWHEHPGIKVKIADTIGAGDAFTAAITHYLLRGSSLERLNEAGNQWGAFIASQPGAMPAISDVTRESIRRKIEG
jgi:fructokinase